ncbi:MAG: hypothetical protein HY902_00120, partial [Deltaproteobacteria bacterium]|nr:hypothetical protein [Deltaproteobacteria bacterium]
MYLRHEDLKKKLGTLALAAACLAAAACGSTATTNNGGNGQIMADTTSNGDTTAGTDTQGGKDTATADTIAADTTTADTTVADTTVADTTAADTTTQDTAGGDTSKDTSGQKFSCGSDVDCKGLQLSVCSTVKCDAGACIITANADGGTCSVAGPCGGSGTCKNGQCAFASGCAAKPCTAKPLKCGDTVELDASKLGTSTFGFWPCDGNTWTGGEAVFDLSAAETGIATVELATSATWTLFEVLPGDATCSPAGCQAWGKKIKLGLKAGATRRLVVDSLGSGTATLTVVCGASATCGDGKCQIEGFETCTSCAKDCGACSETCPTDSKKGCAGATCEACVCAVDPYCCNNSWDSTCQTECKSCNAIV